MDSYDGYTSPRRSRDADSFAGRAPDEYRRRSPSPRRRRGRSRSPMIDRYEPSDRRSRDNYYNGSRDGGHREGRRRALSPNVGQKDSYTPDDSITHNRYVDPLSLDYTLDIKEFRVWWRDEQDVKRTKERTKGIKEERESREDRDKEEARLEKDYSDYLIKFTRAFVLKHRNDEWFKERYVDEVRNPLRSRLLAFRKGAYEQWERDLSEGLFDDFTLEGIYKSEHDGAGGVVEKEEGETTAVGETLGPQDLLPVRGGDLRDEALYQPTLLIKTLAPNISRDRVEEFCKEHLGEGEGGLKWLSLGEPKDHKKFHRMGWIMLNPGSETATAVEAGDEHDTGSIDFEMNQDPKTNEASATSTAEKALSVVNEKKIHDPKALWDLFSAPKRIEKDLGLVRRLVEKLDEEMATEVSDEVNAATKIEDRVEDLKRKGWLQPPVTGPVSAKQNGFDPDSVDEKFEDGEETEAQSSNDVDDMDLLAMKKNLDLMIEYLRRVHTFCFFCVFEGDSVHGLIHKCQGHLRRPRSGLSARSEEVADATTNGLDFPPEEEEDKEEGESSPSQERRNRRPASKAEQQLLRAFNWVKNFEDKLNLILDPETVDLRKFHGMDEEEATVDELLMKHVTKREVQNSDNPIRFDCKLPDCSKTFAAERFWLNHATGGGAAGQPPKNPGHQAFRANIKRDMALVKRFALDPSRISLPRPDQNTKNQQLPPLAAGPLGGMPMMARGAGSWGNNGMMPGDGGLHQPGVMRRGNNRYNSNRSGPYDRRRPNNNGRLSPVRMPNMYGAGHFPPVPPGHPAAAMVAAPFPDSMTAGGGQPPRESVQGRSIKSYEDLDAVGGSGSGELNY
ncbi:hypothetical protein N7532_009952 [Penicillium argentinense]|uniref:DUF4187 domain-containing protein n=1 Tax=Penicillium argentinense TaxID=1131581 RepID=A0A9W9ENZ8_9EURO|nr:uncharacterized protein N7532_009952 [Penicillium argentinense]KAJ5085181.1 hypothetical protein N7532_009952 [Penicillium argentinense]